MSVSWEKVRLVGQFEILAQDNLFSSKVPLVGQFFFEILSHWTDSSVGVIYHFRGQISKIVGGHFQEHEKLGRQPIFQ